MKVLAIHPGANLASARIRVVQMAPHLEKYGVQVECVEYPKGLGERRRLAKSMREADLVLVHYRLPTLFDSILWRNLNTPVVFDFDDAICFRQKPRKGSHESTTRKKRFGRMLRLADAFACGNSYLRSLVTQTEKPTFIAPSPVPIDVPIHDDAESEGPVRLGWIGGKGNLDSLEQLSGVFRRLAEDRDIVLVVIADAVPKIDGVKVEGVTWTKETQESELARLDIGLMPIEDTVWNRGKCAYKLLQYMAAGVASVGSPVGMNSDLIRAGENGLLAEDEEAWFDTLSLLIDDPTLRASLGRAGRETVERAYGYDSCARGLAKFFATVVSNYTSS